MLNKKNKEKKTKSFYSTYEELKPRLHPLQLYPLFRFYSTYEELKPATSIFVSIVFISRFYSTYEELKQHFLQRL